MATFFSDFIGADQDTLDAHGAFNVSLVNDLPLFIDPFLLFNSERPEYQALHEGIIRYLVFLKDKAASGPVDEGLLRLWYCFPEVRQNWFGFSLSGNSGTGLGIDFARDLHANLHRIFPDFGDEQITEGSHLEKVCLISDGVGRDNISDFTTNLILDYLCRYTETFAAEHVPDAYARQVAVSNVRFNFTTKSWERGLFRLPWINGDYVILTPKDMLTRDETWINKGDLIEHFEQIPPAIPDMELRSQVNNYFHRILSRNRRRHPTKKDYGEAAIATVLRFPEVIDYYIKTKEQRGDEAVDVSSDKVIATEYRYVHQLKELQKTLASESNFYRVPANAYDEARERLAYLKDVIENKEPHFLSRWCPYRTREGPANSLPAGLVRVTFQCRDRGE